MGGGTTRGSPLLEAIPRFASGGGGSPVRLSVTRQFAGRQTPLVIVSARSHLLCYHCWDAVQNATPQRKPAGPPKLPPLVTSTTPGAGGGNGRQRGGGGLKRLLSNCHHRAGEGWDHEAQREGQGDIEGSIAPGTLFPKRQLCQESLAVGKENRCDFLFLAATPNTSQG